MMDKSIVDIDKYNQQMAIKHLNEEYEIEERKMKMLGVVVYTFEDFLKERDLYKEPESEDKVINPTETMVEIYQLVGKGKTKPGDEYLDAQYDWQPADEETEVFDPTFWSPGKMLVRRKLKIPRKYLDNGL